MAPLLGAACAAAVNVVAVWAVLGRPARWGVRGQHHFFDILATLTVAGWLASQAKSVGEASPPASDNSKGLNRNDLLRFYEGC